MIRFVTLTACFLFTTNTYSQNFSIAIERQSQTAYIGLDNRLSCTIEGVSCDSIILSTDNGILTKVFPCKYVYRPLKVADSKIIISRKINNTAILVGEAFFMVREIPNPIASIGGLSGGPIAKEFLNAQGGVGAYPPHGLGLDLKYQVKNYFITAIRSKEILFSKYVEGAAFTNDVNKLFDTLQNNDIVTFSLIKVLKLDGRDARANAMEFNIK